MISFALLEISLSMILWLVREEERFPPCENIPQPLKPLHPKHASFVESNVSIGVKPIMINESTVVILKHESDPTLSTRAQKNVFPSTFASKKKVLFKNHKKKRSKNKISISDFVWNVLGKGRSRHFGFASFVNCRKSLLPFIQQNSDDVKSFMKNFLYENKI